MFSSMHFPSKQMHRNEPSLNTEPNRKNLSVPVVILSPDHAFVKLQQQAVLEISTLGQSEVFCRQFCQRFCMLNFFIVACAERFLVLQQPSLIC